MHVLLRGSHCQHLRLGSGLILFAFVATHFINHALGLVSLEAMEAMQTLRISVTRSRVGSVVLTAAFLIHGGLALAKLAQRRTERMPPWEAAQIATGLLIPLLLIDHVVTTRFANLLYGVDDFYKPVLAYYWPERALGQTLLLVIVWVHACIGIHHWLRLADWYRRAALALCVLAVALPTLALAGFAVAGRDVTTELATPGSRTAIFEAARWPLVGARAQLDRWAAWGLIAFGGMMAAIGAKLAMVVLRARLTPRVEITYAPSTRVSGPIGATVLEISRLNGIPHASTCGGRARCSTCRVRVGAGLADLPPPGMAEAITLGAIAAPPGVRLACQIRPTEPLALTPLVRAPVTAGSRTASRDNDIAGVEVTLAVMFLDLRGFTALTAGRLPYDVVFLLNQFFRAVGQAITSEGGWIDKYMGDGLLAVFGRETGAEAGARSALAAARNIDLAIEALARELATDLNCSLEVGIGLHAGPLIIGRIGHADTAAITVIGDTVNIASRLESLTKEKGCQLIVSRDVMKLAGCLDSGHPVTSVVVRGLEAPIDVYQLKRARELPASAL